MIRPPNPRTDAEAILDLHQHTADYIDLESGRAPTLALVEEFFADAPPGGNVACSLKLGLHEDGRLIGVVDLAFGYPEPTDAYLGLIMLAQEARGRGLGRLFLRHVEDAARARRATRLLLAVLKANPRGRAFWEREGFGSPKTYPPVVVFNRTHVRIRLEKALESHGRHYRLSP